MPTLERVVLRPHEAAEQLAISRSKIYELIAAGDIETIMVGKVRRVPIDAVGRYVERQRHQGEGS